MPTINYKPSKKQDKVFQLFDDPQTTEVVYGGAVASGKSYLAAALIVMKCLQHPGIRVGLARNTLTNLKRTTVVSIMEVFKHWGLNSDHYAFNAVNGSIKFYNGSEIVMIELTYLPSDPDFTRLGGMLLTFGVIDEAAEVDPQGKAIFQTRLGRWMNDETGVKPFLLMTCNPRKSSFLYRDYYLPFKDGTLADHQEFIQALPTDNPYLPAGYIENLQATLSLSERRRLLEGQWELEDDQCALFKSADVHMMWDHSILPDTGKTRHISADIAFTSDRCVIMVWEGLSILDIVVPEKSDATLVETLKALALKWEVRADRICWDADGVGLYIKQSFPSGREIHNGGKTVKNHGYRNLKTELYFHLAEEVNAGRVKILAPQYRQQIEEELSVISHKPRESMEHKIDLTSKTEQKRLLGRSPDFADAMAYGMIFHIKNHTMTADDFVFVGF
jgi:phage terminase large subunit